ncbi:DUF481 domain-containing protein [Gilvimarinus agarilyticus]|nr:DUF481 domain-containing protein [Gilvimarinus agarilyticus]
MSGSAWVVAEDAPPKWEASAELGAINTTGNTETTSFNGKLDVIQNLERWKNTFAASVLYKEDQVENDAGIESSEKTAEKYFASVKSAYLLTGEYGNLFGYASHTHDEFGSYRKYTTVSFGYGKRLINAETLTLDAEIGPGYYWGDQVIDEDLGLVVQEEGAMLRAAADLKWTISENATFTQKLGVEGGDDNTRVQSDTAVSTQISGSLQMKVGYSVTHDTDVAIDKEKTDTTTYINLVYNF